MKTWLKNNLYLIIAGIFIIVVFIRLFSPQAADENVYNIHRIMEDSLRREKAELSLQKFNDSIFSNIAFKGIILKTTSANTNYEDDPNFIRLGLFTVKIIGNIYNPKNVPLEVTRIYKLRNLDNAEIYQRVYKDCSLDDRNIGDSIIKNYGEDFYRIKFNTPKKIEEGLCNEIRYTIDFDYFYTH